MKTNPRIEEEVTKTLQVLESLERASPKPFFITRVEARLAGRAVPASAISWVFRPAWVLASLGLVLMLNVSALVYVRGHMTQDEQDQETVGMTAEWEFDANVLDW